MRVSIETGISIRLMSPINAADTTITAKTTAMEVNGNRSSLFFIRARYDWRLVKIAPRRRRYLLDVRISRLHLRLGRLHQRHRGANRGALRNGYTRPTSSRSPRPLNITA